MKRGVCLSLKDAKDFILSCYKNQDENLNKIIDNINSNFESEEAKFLYLSEKAKELGFNFTAQEFKNEIKKIKKTLTKNQIAEFAKENNLISTLENKNNKKFLDSLW